MAPPTKSTPKEADLGVLDFQINKVDKNILDNNIKAPNNFDRIINHIDHDNNVKNTKCNTSIMAKPIRMFCSGVAGN